MRLANKIALITGGSGGIGATIAEAMSKEGASVIIAGRNGLKLQEYERKITESTNNQIYSYVMDIEDEKDVINKTEEIFSRFNNIDILVNSAGIVGRTPFLQTSYEEWKRIIDINLNGTFLCSKVVAKQMSKNCRGSIINITSVLAEVTGMNRSAYSASKGGVKMLTKAMALELAEYNIRVNCIAPATILTDMTKEQYKDEETRKAWLDKIPLNRIGLPEDVAGTAVFLASDEARYITGITIPVDGGRLIV